MNLSKHTIIQDLYVLKEGPNDLRDALNFGDVIYYDRDVNYTENPMTFSGFLNDVPSHENKSDVKVEMSYYDYSEEIWVPMGTTTTSDGNFQVDWHVDNNTFNKLLPHQRSYIPINFTHNEQSNHFYGSYGTFDDSGTIHPFLIDLSGSIYVYSFNESNKQWFINYTIDLGFSLFGWEISNLDLNRDNMTDLVLFDRLSSSDNISLFIFNFAVPSFEFNQTILASDIDLPEPLGDPVFKESCFIVDGNEFLTMYACVSDSSNSVNYIARLDFDESLSMTQENDGTQLPALRVVSALHLAGDTIYIGAVNPIVNGMVNSSLFSIDKDLPSDSIPTFLENSTKGAIVDINSFDCSIGKVVVVGISMNLYNEDDRVLYYVFDTSAETWYKTEFLSGEFESFSNEIYDFRIRQIVKSKQQYAESVLISSSQGLWKTSIATDVITLSSTPVYYAVDSFRRWDLYTYEQDSDTSLIPFSHYPVMEIVGVYEYDRYLDSGSYIYDEIDAIDPSGYFIAPDKRHLACKKSYWNWRPKYQDDGDADIYYQVRYFYKATVAEASGLLSASYETAEHEHVGNVAARNSQTRTQNLGLQLQNLHDPNHWTFYYGTSSHGTKDWNYQSTEVSTGIPYVLSYGVFEDSGITSVADLSMLTEFNNVRMNYEDIHFKDDQVFMNSTLSQFETGQDFNHPENYQGLYENSYIDAVWVEDLSLSSSLDFRTDSLDDEYAPLLETSDYHSTMGNDINGLLNTGGTINLDTEGTVLYKPDISEVTFESDGSTHSESEAKSVLTEIVGYLKAYRSGTGAVNSITIDVSFEVDHNDDSESIKGILLSTAFAQRVESVSYLPPSSNITISLLTTGTPRYFLHTEPTDGSVNYLWYSLNKDDVVSVTYNYGESVNPWVINHKYDEENNFYHSYYLPSNDNSGPYSANWLYEGSGNNNIDKGLFRKVQDSMFIFTYPNEHHVYDFNYLRLDTRNIDNFIVDGEITFRISLNGYLPLILNSYGISLSELVLKQFQCLLFSDKDNLNNEDWDVLYTTNTRKGAHGGFILDSGSVRLNTESKGYPQKGYVDSDDKMYRMVTRFYKDAQTANSITFKIGSSNEFTYDKVDFLQDDVIHSIEVTYDSSTWRFFVDGEENTFFSQGAFSSVTSLYPTIKVSDNSQLEIIEMKNQIFEKVTDPSDWPINDEESVTIPTPGGQGDQENDLTYSEASLKREIIYSFNKDLSNLNYVFDDLRLWADIDHYTEGPSGSQYFNPGYKLFIWTEPSFGPNPVYKPTINENAVFESLEWREWDEVLGCKEPYDTHENQYQIPPPWEFHEYIKQSDESGHNKGNIVSVISSKNAINYLGIYGNGGLDNAVDWPFDLQSNKPYITEIGLTYDFGWYSIQGASLQNPRPSVNYHYGVGGEYYRTVFDYYLEQARNQVKYSYKGSDYVSDDDYIYNLNLDNDPINGYPSSHLGKFADAFSYTKNMEIMEIIIGLQDYATVNRLDLNIDKLKILLKKSETPVAFRDYFYSDQCPDTKYEIPYSQSNAFSILTKGNSKVTLDGDAYFDASGASIEVLYKDGKPWRNVNWDSLIFDTSFGPNTLTFEASSQSVFPNFADNGGVILAHNSINDFRIVPDLNEEEGKGEALTTYPYDHCWWHEQEFVSALPFNLSFSEITEEDISEISDLVFKVQFNASVANFSSWSWRPNLKVYDYIHDEWLPYEGIIYPYHSEKELFVWNAQESGTKQHEYDTAQKLHEQGRYYSNSEDERSDNCTVVFKLSKDKYDFGDLVRYDELLGKSYITLLGLTYVIPGTNVDDTGSWDIIYDDNFNSKGRMNVSSCLSFSHSYARAFRHTDVIKKNVKKSNEVASEFDAPSLDTPWIDLTGGALGSIDVRDIARIDNVFGITSNPKMVCTIMDPTPETPVGVDFWRFNRTEGQLYLPIDAILMYDKFNFTMELWVDFTQDGEDIYKFTPPSFENITIIENVIRDNGDSIDFFYKNFEMDYSFFTDEPYDIFFDDTDGSVEYIRFSESIDIQQDQDIRGVVHYVNDEGTTERDEKLNHLLYNTLKFPFAIAEKDETVFLSLNLNLDFKAGFVGGEGITNILLSRSDYDINLDFYRRESGSSDQYIGTINVEDYIPLFSRYDSYDLNINLKKSGLSLVNLFECFESGKQLVINVTSEFKGFHQGKRLNGEFALEIISSSIEVEFMPERPSIDTVQLLPSQRGVQYINMTSDFMHNPYFADIVDLYGHDLTTEQLSLLSSDDYGYGTFRDVETISRQNGTHSGGLSALSEIDDVYLSLTSDGTIEKGKSLDYVLNGPYVPQNPQGFDLFRGYSNYGDYNLVDDDYTAFRANSSYYSHVPDPSITPQSQYINSISYDYGYWESGTLQDTHDDDANYYLMKSQIVGSMPRVYYISVDFNFNPSLSGKDFYLYVHIESTDGTTGKLRVNGNTIKTGTNIDVDGKLIRDVNSISFSGLREELLWYAELFYFKLVEVTDFSVAMGSSDKSGDLDEEEDWTTITPNIPYTIAVLYPTADADPGWAVVGEDKHYEAIDEVSVLDFNGDGKYIYTTGHFGSSYQHECNNLNIGNGEVFYLRIKVYAKKQYSECFSGLEVKYTVDDGQTYSTIKEISTLDLMESYQWFALSWGGLSINNIEIDALEVRLTTNGHVSAPGFVYVEAVFIEAYYTLSGARVLEFASQMNLDPNARYSDDITLYYSYRFSEGTLSDIDAKLQVYNHGSEDWDLIDDEVNSSFPAEVQTYLLGDNHYSDTYEVLLRMTASSLHGGSPDNYNDFIYGLDLFYIYFENHTLSLTAKVYLDDIVSDKSLYYGYKTNVTQPVELKIWNFLTEEYEIIDEDGSDDFTIYSHDIESKHYDQDQEVLLQIVATNKDTPFELDVDLLHVDKREVSEKEATGNENYWLSLTYKVDSSASFTLWYGDDLGYHVLGTLDSTDITTFKTTFSPTLLDSRIKLRFTFDESTQKTIYLDSLYLFSLSTDGINDLIIESANDYDIFYANLEFNNSPSMVDSHLLNVPLTFQETKNNLYHVFKISSALKNMPFIIDRVKLIRASSDHPEDKTVVPREYYHWVEDEIYVDSTVALDPLITQDSELNVDLSYIYDDWKENEYVDTQPYVHNFSITSAQRIEALTFIVTYSEIPQIQSWFFGTMNDGESYKSLSNVIKKDVNLLDIQLYNHSGDKWETVGYVVYDLNDNDATTFGYFIDRNILDFLAFDGLPENELIYQLKYRFKIEKNYFDELFSTKTFFDMQEVKVILSYSPIKSVISLNPQLLFSVDVTDIIHPNGDDTITNHVNELSFDIDWVHDVSIPSDILTGLDINEVFHDHVLYSNFISLNVTDKFGNLLPISSSNGKFYLRNTAQKNIHDYIKFRYGRYFVDFLLYYRWDLKGLIKSVYGSMFNIQATIELTKCDVRAKVTTVNKELITPISMPENGSICVGDIFGDSSEDIGFMGGFLEKKENNDRFYVKYQFSYLYDADDDDIFDEALDPRVYFAEHVQDACFSSSEVEGFLYYDGSDDKKKLILGDEQLFDLTTTSNVDEAYLYADLGGEVIGTTIYNAYANITYEYEASGSSTNTGWASPQFTATVDRSSSIDWSSPNNAKTQDDSYSSANLVAGGIPVIESWTKGGSTTASSTLTFTKPSSVQVGDLLVIIAMQDDTSSQAFDATGSSDFTFLGDGGSTSSDAHVGFYYRIADGTEGSSESITALSSDEWMGFYVRISGADGTTPIDVYNFAQSSSNQDNHVIPAVTTTIDDCLVLYGLSFDGGDGYTFSVSGTGWSEVDEYQTDTTGYSDVSGCFGSRDLASQGSSGDATVSCSASDGAGYFQIAIAPSGGGGGSVETDYLRCTNFGFSIPTGATIDGIEMEIDKHATLSSIKDYSIRLRDSSGQVGDNKSSTDWWDLTDDDAYNVYGGSTDTWNAGLSVSDINSADFGIDIAVKNHGTSNTAYVDHVRIKVYYTEAPQQYQDSDIVRPDGDYASPQWEGSHEGDHADLINETILDTDDYIYTSSNIAESVIDEFTIDTLNVQGGSVTEIKVKVYGNESSIESTINVYCGGWLGAKQLDMESGQGWYAYTWSGLSLSQSELDEMRIKFDSPSPQGSLSLIGQFSAVEGTSNKFTYNWTGIESAMEGFSTGDETNITVKLKDLDSGSTLDVSYECLLDFESPTSIITIGDGQTDYSLNNFAAPWTLFDVSATDNLEGIINHDEYYYDEITEIEFQVNVHDMNDNLVHTSGFKPLSGTESSLSDLGIPVKYYENHSRYYHVIEFRITDVAGNSIINSSYLGDSYSYDAGIPRILVSNEVTIQFENNLIDVNDLYDGIGNIINFTLIGPDGSELKD